MGSLQLVPALSTMGWGYTALENCSPEKLSRGKGHMKPPQSREAHKPQTLSYASDLVVCKTVLQYWLNFLFLMQLFRIFIRQWQYRTNLLYLLQICLVLPLPDEDPDQIETLHKKSEVESVLQNCLICRTRHTTKSLAHTNTYSVQSSDREIGCWGSEQTFSVVAMELFTTTSPTAATAAVSSFTWNPTTHSLCGLGSPHASHTDRTSYRDLASLATGTPWLTMVIWNSCTVHFRSCFHRFMCIRWSRHIWKSNRWKFVRMTISRFTVCTYVHETHGNDLYTALAIYLLATAENFYVHAWALLASNLYSWTSCHKGCATWLAILPHLYLTLCVLRSTFLRVNVFVYSPPGSQPW